MTLTRMPPWSNGSETLMPMKPPIGSASSRIIAISTPVALRLDPYATPAAMAQTPWRRRRTCFPRPSRDRR